MPTFRLESPRDKFVNSVGPKQTVHTISLSCDIFLRVGLMFGLFAKGNVRFFLSSSPALPFYDGGGTGHWIWVGRRRMGYKLGLFPFPVCNYFRCF